MPTHKPVGLASEMMMPYRSLGGHLGMTDSIGMANAAGFLMRSNATDLHISIQKRASDDALMRTFMFFSEDPVIVQKGRTNALKTGIPAEYHDASAASNGQIPDGCATSGSTAKKTKNILPALRSFMWMTPLSKFVTQPRMTHV